jgi:hypothetical protein
MQMIGDGPVYPMLHWIQQSFFHGTKNRKYVHVAILITEFYKYRKFQNSDVMLLASIPRGI